MQKKKPVYENGIAYWQCSKCKQWLVEGEYYANRTNSNHLEAQCKKCHTETSISTRNKENAKRINKEYMRRRRVLNPEKFNEKRKKWLSENKEKIKETRKIWEERNPEYMKEYRNKLRLESPDRVRDVERQKRAKLRGTAKGKLAHSMGTRMREALRGIKAGRRWQDLAGYTIDQLKRHLERHFQPGMSWDNYGEWHVDHKIPIAAFNFEKPEDIDFKRCWALKNLQPLWAAKNLSKNAKVDNHFQPSLKI
jgi:hypothetical protein